MIFLESLSKISVRNSELEQFSHRPHDAVGDFYLFVQIIETSLNKVMLSIHTQSGGNLLNPLY